MNDLVIQKQLTAVDVRTHVNLIQEVMQAVMKKDTHFGVIPGCKQPTLYKAGSEVLLTTFRIAVGVEVDDLSSADEIRYRVRAIGTHQNTGTIVGTGIGECSTNEEKYKWRNAVCDEEFEETPENRKRIKYQKSYGKVEKRKQIRTEPSDLANTVLKMAKKRAQIDLTLTATAASDIFTQDVEDMPEELRGADDREPGDNKKHEPKAKTAAPQQKNENPISDAQKRLLKVKLGQSGVTEEQLIAGLQVASIDDLKMHQMNDAIKFIEGGHE